MRYLLKEESPWKLIEKVDANPLRVIDELGKMQAEGLVDIKNGKIKLTARGIEEIERLNVRYYNVRCEACIGRGYRVDAFGILDKFKEISAKRPEPTADYDQGYIREEDLMQRLAFIYERGDLEGAKVAIVGDDDLLSIAMALTGLPGQVDVFEIDDRLITFINDVASRMNLNITARKFDVRQDMPREFYAQYDTFVTDPVETIPGIRLFLSRAASTLVDNGAGYFGLTHIEASLSKWAKIERMLLDMNFVITDMLRDFNVYPMAGNLEISEDYYEIKKMVDKLSGNSNIDADFYRSTLIRIEALGKPEPLVSGHVELSDEVYVDDESIVTAMKMRVM